MSKKGQNRHELPIFKATKTNPTKYGGALPLLETSEDMNFKLNLNLANTKSNMGGNRGINGFQGGSATGSTVMVHNQHARNRSVAGQFRSRRERERNNSAERSRHFRKTNNNSANSAITSTNINNIKRKNNTNTNNNNNNNNNNFDKVSNENNNDVNVGSSKVRRHGRSQSPLTDRSKTSPRNITHGIQNITSHTHKKVYK